MKIKKMAVVAVLSMILFASFSTLSSAYKINMEEKNEDCEYNTAEYRPDQVDYWAVVVGLINYEEVASLPVFYNPADYMYDVLCSLPNWKTPNIQLLKDEEATKDAILGLDGNTGIGWLRKNADENDVVLFCFSGHGSEIDDDNGDDIGGKDEIIAPYDVRKEGGLIDGYLVNYISDDMLDNELDKINCKAMCLIFDSCYCGGLVGGTNDVDTGPNRVVITASNKEEGLPILADNGDCFAARFAIALSETSTDVNNDGLISVEEAYTSAREVWIKTPGPWLGLLCYFAYVKAFFTEPVSLLFVYVMAGFRLPKPWPFPAMYDSYEGELAIAISN